MSKFSKNSISKRDFFENDLGIDFPKLLELIEHSEFKNHILNYFEIKKEDNFFIPIKGARTLFNTLYKLNKRFIKQDLVSNLKDVFFDHEKGFGIKFSNLTSNEYLNGLEVEAILATPIHSGEKDFFSSLYDIDKYASRLKAKGYKDILDQNLSLLKQKDEHIKKYRIIHDVDENTFYLRAIVSEDRYFNYDNNLTIVIALLKLHFEMINSSVIYELNYFEYNESFIRMFFKTSEQKELSGIGYLVNVIQVSNDEIKREALKFSNVCSIQFKNSKEINETIDLKPKDIKTKVLSITHGTGPDKAFKQLELFVKSKENFESLYKEIEKIRKIKNHNQIVFLVKSKIDNSSTTEIKKVKDSLLKILMVDVNNTSQLLETFNKLVFLEGLEIDAKEYLRYLIYEALINRN